ncbi:hypothetical protein A3754_12305 [Alcanivorax sp. HI0083]|uniref:MATE family efflux transporter n=1 Tax=unclassified Alcanivorax TaxID=2638842 RepID=UPI0007BAC372|nr:MULTISPECIES: MATE family efflux transporter [unclassified Alcanivorax]KZY35109.1 hypothetical protein A3730_02900 [Alcanivorax sp. HI0044]KZZ26133.1 hypothetical protein A3754_12305 [Alcanivorax sp. HI0083]
MVRTFLAKGISAFGALSLAVIVGNLYGLRGVGVYALAQSVLLGAGILSRRGMDNALIRFVGRDFNSVKVGGYLYVASLRSLKVSVPLLIAIFFLRDHVEEFFELPGLSSVLLGIGFAIPFYTWSFLLAGFFKGVRKPATAGFQENGAISLVAGTLLLLIETLSELQSPDISWLGWSYLVAAVLIAVIGHCVAEIWLVRHHVVRRFSGLDSVDLAEFRNVSLSFFLMSMAGLMQQVLSIMIAGKFLGSVELGLFKSSQQIAISVVFVLMVVNAVFPPLFATLFHQGRLAELERAARRAALLGLILSAPFLLVCLLFPEWILGFFGEGFSEAASLLRILALAQLVNVATGSVAFLLNMTGYDRSMRNIALCCNAIGLLGFFLLSPWLGALGATLALAFVLVAQNLVAMVAVWIKLGIWTFPGPNVLKLLGVRSRV